MSAREQFVRRTLLVLAIALPSCGRDWTSTNPYDPAFSLKIRVIGPDTARSYVYDTLHFQVETEPAWSPTWPQEKVVWEDLGGGLVPLGDRGTFVVATGASEANGLTLRARIGDKADTVHVVIRRRVVSASMTDCGSFNLAPARLVATGTSEGACIIYVDKSGATINYYATSAVAQASSSDTTVVTVAPGYGAPPQFVISGRSEGGAWLRFTGRPGDGGAYTDSILMTVRQRAAEGNCQSTPLAVGDTLRLQASWIDDAGAPMRVLPVTTRWSMNTQVGTDGRTSANVATITSDGLVTAVGPGTYWVDAYGDWGDDWNMVRRAFCGGIVVSPAP